ncbi:hypothetical protein [Caryophanon latum]|uniref:Uncharacterized protein n=1 Tax=Caryophanon latum TaxID=33977 RepID=A0A1C0YPY4_9BACL|nr:hypothetical protein [Caryophanon latum]OCS89225.1 hypothetical protein A6K76_12805 [Caryophanon latum]
MEVNVLFEGAALAYSKQQRLNADVQKAQPLGGKKEIDVMRDGKAVTLTLSDEMKELKAATDEEIAKMFAVQVEDPNDIFSHRPQDQWLIFSQYLHENGAFDGMNRDEIEKLENLLVDITDGLDQLNIAVAQGRDIKSGSKPITQQLTTAEAQLELASSVSALQRFQEKFVTDDAKAGFSKLIDHYTARNEKRVSNYKSIDEKFYAARAKIFERGGVHMSTLTAAQKQTVSITNKLGSTDYGAEEIAQMVEGYKQKFGMLQQQSDVAVLISELQNTVASFATKGISKGNQHYEAANAFVKQKSTNTFERITHYWDALLT